MRHARLVKCCSCIDGVQAHGSSKVNAIYAQLQLKLLFLVAQGAAILVNNSQNQWDETNKESAGTSGKHPALIVLANL